MIICPWFESFDCSINWLELGRVDFSTITQRSFHRTVNCNQFPKEIEGIILSGCKYIYDIFEV